MTGRFLNQDLTLNFKDYLLLKKFYLKNSGRAWSKSTMIPTFVTRYIVEILAQPLRQSAFPDRLGKTFLLFDSEWSH